MRFDPWLLPLLLVACGDRDKHSDDAKAHEGEGATTPHFAVEGRGESSETSTVLEVIEGEEISRLAITGTDARENLIVIYANFHGVDSVVGSHTLTIGPVEEAEAFAVGSIEGRVYQSLRGELRVSMSSDWHSEGEFELTLGLDESSPLALPPGAPEPAAPAAAELTLVGSFQSEWRVTCRSYIRGFTGGHAVSDSPYCQALTF